jgi:hypothetical protein
MKFASEIVINLPREKVLELIMKPGNFAKWQPGVKASDLLSGAAGQPGARSRVVIDAYGLKLDMIETIVDRRLPDVYSLRYDAKGVKNFVENRFSEVGPEQTRWTMTNRLEFSPLMFAAAGFIGDIVEKQNAESMKRFKKFAESEG